MSDEPVKEYDGHMVTKTTIALTKAGDGLSQALAIEPRDFHLGDRVFILAECVVSGDGYKPLKDADDLVVRKLELAVQVATPVERAFAAKTIDETAAKIQADRDARTGAMALDLTSDPLGVYDDEPSGEDIVPVDAPAPAKPRKATAKKATAKRTAKPKLTSVPTGSDE